MRTGRPLSLWWDLLDEDGPTRLGLNRNLDVDVAIVGGGFTGLWTAYYLKQRQPDMRVCVLESERCGYGASGRNGGWASALFSIHNAGLVRRYGLDAMHRMRKAMNKSIDVIGEFTEHENLDAAFSKGGTLVGARNGAQLRRAHDEVAEARQFGLAEEDFRWLEAGEARELMAMDSLLGATFTPHCAVVQPARLVRGLADAAERLGVDIYEHSPVLSLSNGEGRQGPTLMTRGGRVRSSVVVRATEAWTSQLGDSRRTVIPVYSLMIATEPLSDQQWETIGLSHHETFSDHRNMIIYGQRTADNRFAFGGRGAPYHFGSRIKPAYDLEPKVFDRLHTTLRDLFPQIGDAAVTHRWGGPLAIARDWHSSVGFDRNSGMAWAGGYVGDGVTTSNLAGRTLASLILNEGDDLCGLPWVNHQSPTWEREPLRWLGVNVGLMAARYGDHHEARSGRPSKVAGLMSRFVGN